jgi:hypothetical protein
MAPTVPELPVVEVGGAWRPLGQLPALPVRVLVVGSPLRKRPLAARLERLAVDLGAEGGVLVGTCPDESGPWPAGRWDVVVLRASPELILHSPDLRTPLELAQARVLLVLTEDGDAGREWADALAFEGAPPLVHAVPSGDEAAMVFAEVLMERLLHDSTLARAMDRAAAAAACPARLLVPDACRPGLDLGRLLEAHRQEIEGLHSRTRAFLREIEAVAAPAVVDRLSARAARRLDVLAQLKVGCGEIHRDRDPAGWARLARSLDELLVIRREDQLDHADLRGAEAGAPV